MKKLLLLLLVVSMVGSLMLAPVVSADPNKDVDNAHKFLKGKFNLESSEQNFKTMKVKTDELGYTHVKMQQMVDGMPVFGNEYIVHFDNEKNIYTSNGNFDNKANNYKKGAFINANKAIEVAKNEVGYAKGAGVNQEDVLAAELYLYEVAGEYVPTYVTTVNWVHEDSFGNWLVFVDATNGDIVNKIDYIQTAKPGTGGGVPTTGTNSTGTGIGVLGDSKTVNTLLSNGTYYLIDKTRATGGILTYSANNGTSIPGTIYTDIDNTWNTTTQKAAVDAQYYVGKTYDYYMNNFGRNSINGNGMAIKSTVHYSRSYVNAFWNGSQMVFGDGDGVQSLALSGGFDVIAHELTHGVTSYEANLVYQNQSGALNEAMSDIMGTAAEFYVQPTKADWLIGEDIWTPGTPNDALRSMADPTIYGDPAHMNNYINTTQDNGGVHYNSGIINKAAYLIGSKIGADKMGAIFYRALTTYMTSSTNFAGARTTCLQAASDLYGAGSTEYTTVANAFTSVGIN